MSDDYASDPERLRVGIEETRTEMARTLGALQDKLAPARLKQELKNRVSENYDEAKHALRDATIGKVEHMAHRANDSFVEARGSFVETIRQNPIPAAITGIGIVWLLMNRKSAPRSLPYQGKRFDADERLDYGERIGVQDTHAELSYQPESGSAIEGVKERVGQVSYDVKERAGNIVQHASEMAGDLKHKAQDKAGYVAEKARHGKDRIETGFQTMLRDNPLALGAIAVAVGAAVGLALPRTRKEDQLMGPARDQMMNKAQSAARDALEKVKESAEKATDDVKSNLQESSF